MILCDFQYLFCIYYYVNVLLVFCAIFDRKKDNSHRKLDLVEQKSFQKLEYFYPGVVLCCRKILLGKTEFSRSC